MAVGNKTLAASGTAERLAPAGTGRGLTFITITAHSTNAGTIVLGDSEDVVALPIALRAGAPLGASDVWSGSVTDLSDLWLIATSAGDGVAYWSKAS